DQLGPLGILYVILALILVSGRVMGDQDLRILLKRLRLPVTSILFSSALTHHTLTLDAYLAALVRQGFLDRQQVSNAKKAGGGKGKCARVAQVDEDAGQTCEWRWGTRAQSEIGEQAVVAFVASSWSG
ncbi:hypothetical protein FB451DRAFT_1529150, partial [Mycena latifolia]